MADHQPELFTRPASPFVIGTSGWTYADWKGTFYPQGLAQSRWFGYYSGLFSSVEINATFYRAFLPHAYLGWRERAPDGFLYAVKVPRSITHEKMLLDTTEEILRFKGSTSLLGDKLGAVLLQMSPDTPYDIARVNWRSNFETMNGNRMMSGIYYLGIRPSPSTLIPRAGL
jgi:uncharacterized protein YecE (DUF72 family)